MKRAQRRGEELFKVISNDAYFIGEALIKNAAGRYFKMIIFSLLKLLFSSDFYNSLKI